MQKISRLAAAALLTVLWSAADVRGQDISEMRTRLAASLRPDDTVTVEHTGGSIGGRLRALDADHLVVVTRSGPRTIAYDEILRIRRRRNGILLGAILGTGGGIAGGLPLKMLVDNETGHGTSELFKMVAVGAAAGIAVDAVFSRNRTVYRREQQPPRLSSSSQMTCTRGSATPAGPCR